MLGRSSLLLSLVFLAVKGGHGYLLGEVRRVVATPVSSSAAPFPSQPMTPRRTILATTMMKATAATAGSTTTAPSWSELQKTVGQTPVGGALDEQVELRKKGQGSAHVQNRLRTFGKNDTPQITLFRDHAGWCPYCEKTMLLIEEKEIPIKIDLVPMRSYGDKPREFLAKVPGGLLPAIEVNGQIITESQVIMELLDQWHTTDDGYKPMMPETDAEMARYHQLARLERELFSWWCTLVFRPEGPRLGGGGGGILGNLLGNNNNQEETTSASMKGFLDCLRQVDEQLLSTDGPWFFGEYEHPTMIDFIYVSHVERMLASVAYWKGLNLRDVQKWNLVGLNRWLEAFEKREPYLAFKSDYFTHVMDIPPQYGPGYDGGFPDDQERFANDIRGRDGSWHLPLTHDDPLQPLYHGPPLPGCVLQAMGIEPDRDGSYLSCDPQQMKIACRTMAAWKLAGNGMNVAKFAARGGPQGAKNPRKTFGAELADPYAAHDDAIQPVVDKALRIICLALLDAEDAETSVLEEQLRSAVPDGQIAGVVSSLAYLRDRVGVPRDLPLAAARYLRAYLNWGIDALSK